VLERFKDDPATRHIPLFVISATEDPERGLARVLWGPWPSPPSTRKLDAALGRLRDVADRPVKQLLVVEGDSTKQGELLELLGSGDLETTLVSTSREALDALEARRFDCVVLGSSVEYGQSPTC
jgi:CheY-like chemotaxis protein